MISYIKGELAYIDENTAVIENHGMGFNVNIPGLASFAGIGLGSTVKVYTYMAVREDNISLYGFISREELNLFKLLISVNGIGPKAGLAILSVMSVDDLRIAIVSGDSKAISKAPGVGAKSAQRVILELKDKIDIAAIIENDEPSAILGSKATSSKAAAATSTARVEVMEALVALGVSESEAYKATAAVENSAELTVEEYLKQALKLASF